MSELKKCPFCGGEAILNVIEPHTHRIATFMLNYKGGAFVECSNCTAGVSGETEQEAIAAWNHRATAQEGAER